MKINDANGGKPKKKIKNQVVSDFILKKERRYLRIGEESEDGFNVRNVPEV